LCAGNRLRPDIESPILSRGGRRSGTWIIF
jgi:hypothetical protein